MVPVIAPKAFLGKSSVEGSVCGSVEPWPVSGGSAPAGLLHPCPASRSPKGY